LDRKILDDVYQFWIGTLADPEDIPAEKAEIWFKKSDETDNFIREKFGAAIPEAANIEWHLADLTREEQIGLIVLLDQFPRNIFRTSGESFAYDAKARALAKSLIEKGWRQYPYCEQCFLMLPLEHSEDIADQDYCVQLFAERVVGAPEKLKESCRGQLDYATKHRDLIRKFDRFPHRNELLGRQSTPEEETFLKENGRGF
jgi:uncharacterized protein (DUF924 family)